MSGARAARKSAPERRRGRALRVLAWLAVAGVASVLGLWIAIHRFPTLGPALADGARSVLGPGAVAWMEDTAYGVQDAYNRWRYKDAAPTSYWAGGSAAAPAEPAPPLPVPASSAEAPAPRFPPPGFAPPHPKVALPGDGAWLPIPDPASPIAPPALYKALVHPDPHRTFAVVAIVAVDLSRVGLHAVPGFAEPASVALPRSKRPGMVDPGDTGSLLAAFNGGWQAVHGRYGMMVDGVTLLPPRPKACTIAVYKDAHVRIRTWTELAPTEPDMVAYRQTPACLLEQGVSHPALEANELTTSWGAAIDGQTVIRRSALGIDKTGGTLFYGMGDGLTAQSIAHALTVAGAHDVAQLDVNWAFPRFLIYGLGAAAGPEVSEPLIPGTSFKPAEYVRIPEYRDFFYLTRKKSDAPDK